MENVWDYPRPPALEPCTRRARVQLGGETIADSTTALRVLETSHPPTIYIPPADIRMEYLRPTGRTSFCEWKGRASYYDVVVGDRVEAAAAWYYRAPSARYAALQDLVAFYPGRMDACLLDDEAVQAQPGDFYGGWLTKDIEGRVKGGPGTLGW